MDFEPDDDQKLIQEQVRKFLQEKVPLQENMKLAETLGTCGPTLWQEMSDLGWMGIPIPEQYGGLGLGFLELCLVLEEMGSAVMVGPYFASVVLGGIGILIAGNEEQKARWLPGIADGSTKATVALYESLGLQSELSVTTQARRVGDAYELSGTKSFVLSGEEADLILCPAYLQEAGNHVLALFVVPVATNGVSIHRLPTLDITRPFSEVRLEGVIVPEDHLLGEARLTESHLSTISDYAAAGLCAEMAGACRRLVDTTTNYARERVQFDKPIGAFQAIKHKCADMHVRAVTTGASARYLAWTADQALKGSAVPLSFSASVAKSYCANMLNLNACEAIQIHGGNGFSWEYGLHLYLKRAKACEQLFGDSQYHQERVIRSTIALAASQCELEPEAS